MKNATLKIKKSKVNLVSTFIATNWKRLLSDSEDMEKMYRKGRASSLGIGSLSADELSFMKEIPRSVLQRDLLTKEQELCGC